MPGPQVEIIHSAYKNKGKSVELVTTSGIVHHGQCLIIHEMSANRENTKYQVQVILMDHKDSTWKQTFFAIERVRFIKPRPKYEYGEDNDYVHIHMETLPGKYHTVEGQSIYRKSKLSHTGATYHH